MPDIQITEKKRVRIVRECPENPVYLCWLNKRGGREYWLFNGSRITTKQVSRSETFNPFVGDLENARALEKVMSKQSGNRITLGVQNLDTSSLRGLSGILESIEVEMLVSSTPVKWMGVRVDPGSWLIDDSSSPRGSLEFDIILPEIILPQQ